MSARVPMTSATPLVWLDIETTGLLPERHEIISIGAVRDDGEEREWFIIPELVSFEPEALAVNGFSPKLWSDRGAIGPWKAASEFAAFVSTHILAAHNAPFDVSWLRMWARGLFGMDLNVPHRAIDTVSLLWPYVMRGELESPSLKGACAWLGIPIEGHHNALSDAKRAKAVYEALRARGGW